MHLLASMDDCLPCSKRYNNIVCTVVNVPEFDTQCMRMKPLVPSSPSLAVFPLQVPVRPTHLLSTEVIVEPSRTYPELAEITPSPTPVFVSEVEASVATDMPSSQVCTCYDSHAFW